MCWRCARACRLRNVARSDERCLDTAPRSAVVGLDSRVSARPPALDLTTYSIDDTPTELTLLVTFSPWSCHMRGIIVSSVNSGIRVLELRRIQLQHDAHKRFTRTHTRPLRLRRLGCCRCPAHPWCMDHAGAGRAGVSNARRGETTPRPAPFGFVW